MSKNRLSTSILHFQQLWMCTYIIDKLETSIFQFFTHVQCVSLHHGVYCPVDSFLSVVESSWYNINFWSLGNNYVGGSSVFN